MHVVDLHCDTIMQLWFAELRGEPLPFFLCIFSAFYAFPRKDLSFCKFHPFPCQNRTSSPCYTEHSSKETPTDKTLSQETGWQTPAG